MTEIERIEADEGAFVPGPISDAEADAMFRAAIAKGFGEEDICATIKVLEGITGVEVKKKDS